ncbi:MAG: hypothetical protein ACJ75N_13480 [Actinomycetes bacterium]
MTTEPLLLVADLLYALGWSLWTGVVVVFFVQIWPEAKPATPWLEVIALVALVIPFLGWVVGVVLVSLSRLWTTGDKLIATLGGLSWVVAGLGGLSMAARGSTAVGLLNRVAPASAVTIQLISATTLMTASLSLVNQPARPSRCDVGPVASCGHSQLITSPTACATSSSGPVPEAELRGRPGAWAIVTWPLERTLVHRMRRCR